MSNIMNIVIIISYAILSVVIGYIISAEFSNAGSINALFGGACVFLFSALIHENLSRRKTQTKLTRHLLALKKAYDQTRLELDKSRIDNQRLMASRTPPELANNSANIEVEPAFTRPSFLDPVPELEQESNLYAASKQRQIEDEDDFRNLFSTSPVPPERQARNPANTERGERAPMRRTPPPPPKIESPVLSEQEMSQVSSEVKVLHSLVEQLYSDIDPPSGGKLKGNRDENFLESKTNKPLKGAKTTPPGKLRIVNDVDEKHILEFVRDGLRKDHVDLYLQPIVSLPQRKRRFFECTNHIRTNNGTIITQEQYRQIAIDAGILSAIDNMLLFRCIQLLRKLQGQDYSLVFFCNIVLHSLLDKEFFFNFAQYLKTHALLAPNIVLELAQKDFIGNRQALTTPMKILGKMGYRFSLDGVTDFDMNVQELLERNFGYLKVDASLVAQQVNQGKGHVFRTFKQRMDEAGIDVIIENIESEQMLLELLDFNIDYGQGFLFGEPRTLKDVAESLKVS